MKNIYILLLCCSSWFLASSQPILSFTQQPTVTGVTTLVDIVNAKDGSNRIFLVQQNGIIKIWNGTSVLATPFLDISNIIAYSAGGERGLLSLAFHPNYSTNGYFFVYYNNTGGSITVARYSVSGDANVATSAGTVLITIPHPTYANHNGGKLNFGPDGYLYFGTGDGGSGDDPFQNSQSTTALLGKMLRIDVNGFATAAPFYTIPPTNPFLTPGDGIADEIYDLGLRNPWRWSFDRLNGDMWIADVGQNAWEEFNHRTAGNTAGRNYQWRCMEGLHVNNASGVQPCTLSAGASTAPIYEYTHDNAGGFSVTGGYVYRNPNEFADMYGWYIAADYVKPNAFLLKPNGSGGYLSAVQPFGVPANITTFGEAENGTIYAGTHSGGVYKVILSGLLPVKLVSFSGSYLNGNDDLQWTATTDLSLLKFEIEKSEDGLRFASVGSVVAKTSGSMASYQFATLPLHADTRFYRLKMIYDNGSLIYSPIVKLNSRITEKIIVLYDGNGQIRLNTPYPIRQINVVNSAGQKVKVFSNVQSGSQVLETGHLPTGIYWVQCMGDEVENYKIGVF
ncbi:MAG: PQQ-dependent sugar dehydrogenase [Chitinophagaceae bacterium]